MKTLLIALAVIALIPPGLSAAEPTPAKPERVTIAEHRLPRGDIFKVTQTWNGRDGYLTDLRHISATGEMDILILDRKDIKRASVPLTVDQAKQTVTVILSGDRKKVIAWDDIR